MLFLACISLCMVACDKDEPPLDSDSTGLKKKELIFYTGYWVIPEFEAYLYCEEDRDHNLRLCHTALPWGDALLLDCGVPKSMDSFKWTETSSDFRGAVKLIDGRNNEIYYGKIIIFRRKIYGKDGGFTGRYGYALIRFIEPLYSDDGEIRGLLFEYKNPYTPLKK